MADTIEKLFCEMYQRMESAGRKRPQRRAPAERPDRYRQVWKLILEDLHRPAEPAAPVPEAG